MNSMKSSTRPLPLKVSLARFSSSLAMAAALSVSGGAVFKAAAAELPPGDVGTAENWWNFNANSVDAQLGDLLGASATRLAFSTPETAVRTTVTTLPTLRSLVAMDAGGTLDINVLANTSVNGLSQRVFTGIGNDTTNVNFAGTALFTAEVPNLNSATFVSGISVSGAAQYLAKLQITNPGDYRFFTASDDGSRVFIDGVLVVNNDGPKAVIDMGSAPVTLSAGLHDIRVDYIQGTGGAGETLSWSGGTGLDVGATETALPTTSLFTAETNTLTGASNAVIFGTGIGSAVSVAATSTVNLNGTQFTQAQVGDLTFSSASTLTLNGLSGKALRAAGNITLVAGSSLINGPDLVFDGVASDGGGGVTLTKAGTGRLILDQTTVANALGAGTQFEIQAGSLVLVGTGAAGSFNPLGAAGVRLNGGNLVLDTTGGGPVFDNAINVLQNASIQDVANAQITTLGSATRGISIAAGKTLTLDAIAGGQITGSLGGDPGATLKIAGPISGGATTTIALASTQIGSNPVSTRGGVIFSGNNTGFTGKVTIPSGMALQVAGVQALSGASAVLSGGTLSLLSDGNGTSTPETFAFNDTVSLTASSTIAVGRAATGPLFIQAANKTMRLAAVDPSGLTLTVTNNNGYGLEITGPTALTGNATYSVTTASGSNGVQGLTVSGAVSGAFDVIKTGAGALVLGNNTAANNFGGAGHVIDIQGGIVAAGSDAALGDSGNSIKLNVNTATGVGLRATGSFSTSRTINFLQSNNAIEVSAGNTLTLNAPFAGTTGTSTLVKNDSGTLVLAVANAATWTGVVNTAVSPYTMTGGLLINGGVVRLTDGGALGAATNPVMVNATSGAAVQISGGITVPNPIVLNPLTTNSAMGGINFGGQLQSVSGVNTWSGAITINQDAGVGADAGSTLNLSGGATLNAHVLNFGGAGDINVITNGILLPYTLTKFGTGTTTFSVPVGVTTGNGVLIHSGTLAFAGGGTLAAGGKVITVNPTGSLTVDDRGTATLNRLGINPLTLLGGTFNYVGNATADSNETVGATSFSRGINIFTVTPGAGQANLIFGTVTRASNGTALFRGTGLGAAAGAGVATIKSGTTGFTFVGAGAAGTTTKGIIPWALADASTTGTGTAFATADTATGLLRPLNASSEMVTNLFTTGTNALINSAPAAINSTTLNSLTLGSGAAVSITPSQTLTVTSGGVLALSGTSSISGGFLALGGADLIAHALGNLSINSTLTGTGGLTKDGAGTLTLGTQNFASGNVNILQGTLKLAGGNNTLLPNQFVVLTGGTFDLNGTTQQISGLLSDGAIAGQGGTVTGNAASTLVVNQDNTARNFAGQTAGAMTLLHSGANQNWVLQNVLGHSGATVQTAGTMFIRDSATLLNTSSIDINFAGLTIDNNSLSDNPNRISDTAPVTARGGQITFQGRAQTASSEKLGPLTIASGASDINVATGGTGINSSDLTFASMGRTTDGTLNFRGLTGLIGSTSRLLFTTAPTVSNNIMAPWAVNGGAEFVSYNATYGVGSLNAVGFPGYDGTALPAASAPTQNIRLAAIGTVASGGQTINTLNMPGAVTLNFTDNGDVLNLAAGGLLKSGNNTSNIGSFIDNGQVTAGGAVSSGTVPLYLHLNAAAANPLTMNSRIVNNPNGAAVRLVYTTYNGGTLILADNLNSYTGGTVVNGWIGGASGNLTIGATGNLPAGGLTLNNGSVIQQAGGIIDPANTVTLNGPSTLTLVGANSLAGITFNDNGGSIAPTVTTGGTLSLTGPIASNPLNIATVATLAGSLDLGAPTRTVSVGAFMLNGQNFAPLNSGLTVSAVVGGTGGILKNGAGNLLLSGANTFGGGVNVGEGGVIIGANSTQTGTTVVSGPLGTGPVTMGANTTLLSSGTFTLGNALALSGNLTYLGTAPATANALAFPAATTLPASLTIAIPQPTSTLRLVNITTPSSNITKTGLGNLVLSGVSGLVSLPGGGPLSLLVDGDGTGTPNVAQVLSGITVAGAPATITVDRLGTTFAPNFALAVNKTLQFSTSFESGGNAINIVNNSGYGIEALAPVTFTANQTYSVATASASNVVQGLTLSGTVAGGFGILKTGAGALVLNNAANTFGNGTTSNIDIQGGIVAARNDGALGNAANSIILDVNAATGAGFRATGTFATGRVFTLAQAANAIEVTLGNTLTLNSPFGLGAVTNVLNKNDNGTLRINASNPTWTGGITINTGVVLVDNPALTSPLGTGIVNLGAAITGTGGGSAVQLGGGVTISGATLNFNGQQQASGINYGGGLQSVSGSNTWTGPITATTTGQYYGADAGATLTVSPISYTSTANSVQFVGAGTINANFALPNGTVTKYGTGTVNLGTSSPAFLAALTVNAGTVSVGGSGVTMGGTGLITVNGSATFNLNDSVGVSTANRLGGRALTLNGSTFIYTGNAAGSTGEVLGALNMTLGGSVIANPTSGGAISLTFASLTLPNESATEFSGANLGTASNIVKFTTAPGLTGGVTAATNGLLAKAVIITDGSTLDFATYHTNGTATNTNGIQAFSAYNTAVDVNTAAATDTVQVTGAMTTSNLTASKTLNALKFSGDNLTLSGSGASALTLTAAGVVVTGSSTGSFITVPILQTAAALQNVFHINTGSTLTVTSLLANAPTTSFGIAKAEGGTLVIAPRANSVGMPGVTANVYQNGTTDIFGGTLKLGGGTNAITPGQFLRVYPGATLDLNGGLEYVAGLLSDNVGAIGTIAGSNGTITSSGGPATLVTSDNSGTRDWVGSITGPVSVVIGGAAQQVFHSPQSYTGSTVIPGNTLLLKDGGSITGSSSITVNYAGLSLDNTGLIDMPGRLGSVPLTLNGATLTYLGRYETLSSESIGAVTLGQGLSNITTTAGTTNINAAALTLANLTRGGTDATLTVTGALNVLGALGNGNTRVLVSAYETTSPLVNRILGGWAVDSTTGEFLTYVPGLGLMGLTNNGAAGYDISSATFPATALATQNMRLSASATLPAGGLNLNALSVRGTTNITFTNPTDVLNLTSGGYMGTLANTTLGATVDGGRLTAGGTASTGVSNLYFTNTANTNTINVRVVDNGFGSPTRLIASAAGGTVALANPANSYTGGTVLNGGSLTLNGATPAAANSALGQAEIPAGGLTINGGTVNMTLNAGQIDPGNAVTINGSGVLNLLGNNTLASLSFNNIGGGSTNPTVNTFVTSATAATIPGVLTLGAGGVSVTSANVASTATINGRLDLGANSHTFDIGSILANGQDVNALQASLNVQGISGSNPAASITKTGNGVLQFLAPSTFTGALTVNAGSVQFSGAASGLTAGQDAGSRFSALILNGAGTRANLVNDATLGSLAGSGVVINTTVTGRTLNTGFDNTSTLFSGAFARFTDYVPNPYQVNKIGTGTMTLTGVSNNTNNLLVAAGGITLSGAGRTAFANNTVYTGASLTLDNSAAAGGNVNNRLGGSLTSGTLTLAGGEFRLVGNASAATTEALIGIGIGSGASTLTLVADPAQPLIFNLGTTQASYTPGATVLFRGLSNVVGAGNANLLRTGTVLNYSGGQGGYAAGSPTNSIRPDLLGDASPTGTGTGFILQDTGTNNYRPLSGTEMANTPIGAATTTTNYAIDSIQSIRGNIAGNSLVLNAGGGIANALPGVIGSGGLETLTLNTFGLLAQAGNAGINVGGIASTNSQYYIYSAGAGTSLQLTGSLISTQGLVKGGAGSVSLNSVEYNAGQTTLNQGLLTLNSGSANTLYVAPSGTTPVVQPLQVNGGTLDLNGKDQIVGSLSNNNSGAYANTGGTVTNLRTGAGNAATFTTSNSAATIFGGILSGNLNFTKTGATALTLTSAHDFSGTTTVRGSTLILRDAATLGTTPAVNLNFAGLTIDQTGLNPLGNLDPVRIPAATPLNLTGGTFSLISGGSVSSSASLGSVNALGGYNTINVNTTQNQGSSATLNIGNLTQGAATAAINFTNTNGILGTLGFNNGSIFVNSITPFGGTATAPASLVVNGMLPAWLTINNGADFATYSAVNGLQRIGYLGGVTNQQLATTPGTGVENIATNTAATAIPAGTNLNYNGLILFGAQTLTYTTATNGMTLTSGGLMTNQAVAVVLGNVANNGFLTAGGNQLYLNASATTGTTVNSIIKDNASALTLNKLGTGTLTLGGTNTFTGGTVVSGGTLTFAAAATSVLPAPASGVGLTINNATVTQTAGAVIAPQTVVINGSGVLTMNGSNSLPSVNFNNLGGGATPTLAVGTALTLSSATPLTSVNDNIAFTPTVSGTALLLSNATPVISTSGISPTSLVISAPITSAGGVIMKMGAGTLALSGASTFTNGFELKEGSLIFGVASTGTLPAITNGPVGTGTLTLSGGTAGSTLLSDGTLRIIGNPVSVTNGGFSFGGVVAGNNTTLSNIVTLGAGANSINVAAPLVTGLISGKLTGGTNLTKTGPGILTLSSTLNDYAGSTTVSAGVLKVGAAAVIPDASPLIVNTGAVFDINGFAEGVASISGTGLISNSGAAATLTVGLDGTDSTFSGTLLNGTNSLSLTKAGAGTTTLNTTNFYTGSTNMSAASGENRGVLVAAANNALGTGGVTVVLGTGSLGVQLQLTGGITLNNSSVTTSGAGLAGGVSGVIRNVSGNNTITSQLNLTGGGGSSTYRADAGSSLTFSGTVGSTATALRDLTLVGAGNFIFSGLVRDDNASNVADKINLLMTATGKVTLSGLANTYTGTNTLSSGTVSVAKLADGGLPSSIGTSTSAPANLIISGATLQYVGAGDFTDRQFTIGTNGATLDASGTGPVNFTSPTAPTLSGAGAARLLTLAGLNPGDNTLAAPIPDNGQTTLNKADAGKWILSGASTYTGPTNVLGGTLSVSGSISASTQINVAAGAKLALSGLGSDRLGDLAPVTLGTGGSLTSAFLSADNSAGAFTETLGTLNVAGKAILDMGTGVSTRLNFADSSAIAWGSPATLSIYNWSGTGTSADADQIFVGAGFGTLTAAQLNAVTFYYDGGNIAFTGAQLLATGQLVPVSVPEPTSWMLAASALGLLGSRRLRRSPLASRER